MIPNCKRIEKWKDLTLISPWIIWSNPSGNIYHNPQYRKENNRVYLRGLVEGGNARSKVVQLPNEYRPIKIKRFPCACRLVNEQKEIFVTCDIKSDGYLYFDTQTITDLTSIVDYLFLDSINYEID